MKIILVDDEGTAGEAFIPMNNQMPGGRFFDLVWGDIKALDGVFENEKEYMSDLREIQRERKEQRNESTPN